MPAHRVVPVAFSSRRVLLDLLVRHGGYEPERMSTGVVSLLNTFPDEGCVGVNGGGYDCNVRPLAVARLVPDVSKEKFDSRAYLLFDNPNFGLLPLINAEPPKTNFPFLAFRSSLESPLTRHFASTPGMDELVAKSGGPQEVYTVALDGIYLGNAHDVVRKRFGDGAARFVGKPEGVLEQFKGVGERMYRLDLVRFEDEE